jgi:beta-lactamase regulating signal transducer with metallopeptidase domain
MTADFLSILINAALRALLLASVAGVALQLFRVRQVTVRLAVWTAVLYGALLMPVAVATAPPLGITVRSVAARPATVLTLRPGLVQDFSAPIPARPTMRRFDWPLAIAAGYFGIAALLFARLLIGWMFTARLRRGGCRLDDSRLQRIIRRPELLESERVAVPIALGWLKPAILLPVSWREWEPSKLDAVLTHELSHIQRGDYATLLLSSLHRCVFWFSPLSWWLDRHLRDLAEQASDDSVLLSSADHTSYAEVVLGFFEARLNSRGRIRWQGVAMASAGRADRRIDRILATNRRLSGPAKRPVLAALAGITLPLLYLSAAITPRTQVAAQPARILAQATFPVVEPIAPQTPARKSVKPVAQLIAQTAPTPQRDPAPRDKASDSYIIVHGNSMTMSGSSEDLQHVRALQEKLGDEFLWFRRSGKSYIVRDKATVRAARELFESNNDLTQRKAYLADLKAKLSDQKAVLGERKNSLLPAISDLTRELDILRQHLAAGGTQEQLAEVRALIAELQTKVAVQHASVGEQQAAIGELQAQLSERQAQLSEQQAVLSEMQSQRSEEAFRELRTLLDNAIQKGLAEPESR